MIFPSAPSFDMEIIMDKTRLCSVFIDKNILLKSMVYFDVGFMGLYWFFCFGC